jgi:hypothetical protein
MGRESTLTKSVAEILLSYNTDKARYHSYGPIYQELLAPIRGSCLNVLELGILNGESLRAWAEIFPYAFIHGLDAEYSTLIHEGRITSTWGYQSDPTVLELVGNDHGPFDFICDDASHDPTDQITSLLYLWQYLRSDGIYVIEDVFPQNLHMFQSLPCTIHEGNQNVLADNLAIFRKS